MAPIGAPLWSKIAAATHPTPGVVCASLVCPAATADELAAGVDSVDGAVVPRCIAITRLQVAIVEERELNETDRCAGGG